jgi:uncharacterized membrane protein
MKIFRLMLSRETLLPVLALSFASVVSAALVIGWIIWTRRMQYASLLWNLFLAWMPMVFALLACEHQKKHANPSWRFLAFAAAWLIFFPNAPYIFTDIIHLTDYYDHFWVDLMLILINALTGLIIGFVSLYLMQSCVRRIGGEIISWLFIVAVALLSGFGISLGRFLRLNSWDIATPWKTFHRIGAWVIQSPDYPGSVLFSILFATFVFLAYLMLYTLTYLPPQRINPAAPPEVTSPLRPL